TLLARCPHLLEPIEPPSSSHSSSSSSGHDHDHDHREVPGGLERLLSGLFPQNNPSLSSVLATLYISLFPNLLLLAIPSSISPKVLRLLVSFAVGGLLGDVFLHLMPHIFMYGHERGHSASVATRNVVYGCAIFSGLLLFFVVDKVMHIFGATHSHDARQHSHSRHRNHHQRGSASHGEDRDGKTTATATNAGGGGGEDTPLRRRSNLTKARRDARDDNDADDEKGYNSSDSDVSVPFSPETTGQVRPIRLSAYLNLIADATHNFTDGLAISASFYLSFGAGLSTFVAVFFHEIPHELGDFAILIQSGFSRSTALMSQFFTAIGALAGTVVGVLIEEHARGRKLVLSNLMSASSPLFVDISASAEATGAASLLPASVSDLLPATAAGVPWSELVIPFTAGGFLYIGSASVIPELLESLHPQSHHYRRGRDNSEAKRITRELAHMVMEIGSMLLGLGLMAAIALYE
ncbi:hypothetical protein EV182_003545, partial [Spiromyces aspiralis]